MVALGAITETCPAMRAGLPVAGSKRWWWRPLGSKGLAIPAEVATARSAQRDGACDGLRLRRPAQADAPGAPVGMAAQCTAFADVEKDARHAGVPEQRRHPVGDVALGDAVEGDRHAGPSEADFRPVDGDGRVADQRLRPCSRGLARPA